MDDGNISAMADVTEIYMCKEGQALKEGKLEVSHDIITKQDAQYDAAERCKFDKTLYTVSYYKVTADGDFKVFFTYTNPYFTKTTNTPAQKPQTREHVPTAKRRPPAKPATLMEKILKGLGMK